MTKGPIAQPTAPIGRGAMDENAPAAPRKSLLLAWAALVGASTLLIVGVRLVYDVPDDLRYRYSTVVFAVLVSAVQLAIVVMIARRDGLREMLALRPPTSRRHAAVIGVVIIVGTYVLLASVPFLQGNEDQGVGAPWDPSRAFPFVLNAMVLVAVSPVLEELMFRGLGSRCSSASAKVGRSCSPAWPSACFTACWCSYPRSLWWGSVWRTCAAGRTACTRASSPTP